MKIEFDVQGKKKVIFHTVVNSTIIVISVFIILTISLLLNYVNIPVLIKLLILIIVLCLFIQYNWPVSYSIEKLEDFIIERESLLYHSKKSINLYLLMKFYENVNTRKFIADNAFIKSIFSNSTARLSDDDAIKICSYFGLSIELAEIMKIVILTDENA